MSSKFSGRLGIQQRVCPEYRAAFFDLLASRCDGGLSVFCGEPRAQEHIHTAGELQVAQLVKTFNRQAFDPASEFYFCWQEGIEDWLEAWQPQAVIVEANPRYLSTPRAVRWMHRRELPVLGWGLGAPPMDGALGGWPRRWRKSFLSSLDGLIAYSQRGTEEYRQSGIPAERVFVALNAVSLPPTGPPPARSEGFTGQPRVLFVGRLQRRKRVDLVLRACAALPERLQPRLVVVGDGPERSNLEEMGRAVYPAVEFTGDRRGEALQKLFNEADLFVLPGTGGLALQQAMAAGLPVIAAEGDGTQEDLVRVENGWLVPAGDLAALTEALQRALSDPARLRRMGIASHQIVRDEANIERMADAFIRALIFVTEGIK